MSEGSQTPWSCLDPAVKDPFDPRYVPEPTTPAPGWLKLQEEEAAAQADPDWAPHHQRLQELQLQQDLQNPPFYVPPPPPSQHLIQANNNVVALRINDGSSYGELVKGRPPPNSRPPFGIDISIVEICTFFPSWTQIPLVILRAVRNGYKRQQLAKMQCDAVNITDFESRKGAAERIQQHMSYGGKLHCGKPNEKWSNDVYATSKGMQHDLTADQWKLRRNYPNGKGIETDWGDLKLVNVGNSVPRSNWPKDEDRLHLTACLEYAVDHPDENLDTSHWDWIIQNHLQDFEVPRAPRGQRANRDTVAHERLFPEEYE